LVPQLSLLIVDDHEVVREGLRFLLQRHPQFSVVAEAATVQEAVEAAKQYHPNVAVLDIRLPGRSGIEACREIKDVLPDCRVVMLTSYADEGLLMEAISAGASGYIRFTHPQNSCSRFIIQGFCIIATLGAG